MSTELNLYNGVELSILGILGILCAAVKVSVESVVESLVSRYEVHFDKARQLIEENALHEMEIAENGPSIFREDPLLEMAMNSYWKGTTEKGVWHFVRTSSTVMNYGKGHRKTEFRLLKEGLNFPIMDS